MRRPLSLICLVFMAAIVIAVQFTDTAIPDYERWDGHSLTLEGQVYQKEYKVFRQEKSLKKILIVYLKSIRILNYSELSTKIPQNQIQNIMCYIQSGAEPPMGSTIRVKGKSECFSRSTNPGEFDMKNYYHIMKISFKLGNGEIKAFGREYNHFREGLFSIKNKLAGILDSCFDEKNASVMKAILLGDKSNLDRDTKQLYKESGILHILAISGLHISFVGMGLYKVLCRCGISNYIAIPFSIILIWCYGIMVGMSASAVRAILMFVLHLTAKWIGRTYDMITAVSVAAVLLLIEQPRYVEYNGFLFSFGAIAAIGILLPAIYDNTPGVRKENARVRKAKQSLAAGMAVALVTLPIHLIFYFQFPLLSIFLNLLIIPLMSIVMCDGLFCMLAGSFLPVIAGYAAYINVFILWLYEKCCLFCKEFAYGNMVIGQPRKWQIVVYAAMLSAVPWIRGKMLGWWKWQWIIAAIGILTLNISGGLKITAIDVGQGDSIHIQNGMENHYLIDGGSSSKSRVGTYQIMPYLKSQGVYSLKGVFVTHGDEDHCNGIKELLAEANAGGVKIERLVLPDIGKESRDEKYTGLEKAADENGISVCYMKRGQYIQDGNLRLTCLNPVSGYNTGEANEYSLVLHLAYGDFSGLFTGDAEGEGEEMLKRYIKDNNIADKRLTLLKVAHHGSRNSTDEELLEMLNPRIAIISCGKENQYGHPHKELLERLSENQCKAYLTSEGGAITVWTDGRRIGTDTFY